MGSAFRKSSDTSHEEALFGLLAAASAADGSNNPAEMTAMARILQRVEPFASLSSDAVAALRQQAMVVLKGRDGIKSVIDHYAPHLRPEGRPACYALCLEILQADGVFDAQEAGFLGLLRPALGLSEENATRIRHAVRGGQVLLGTEGGQLHFGPPQS